MEFFTLMDSLIRSMSAVSLDDSSMSALALLVGIGGGWILTGLRQPRVKKAKIARKDDSRTPRG